MMKSDEVGESAGSGVEVGPYLENLLAGAKYSDSSDSVIPHKALYLPTREISLRLSRAPARGMHTGEDR